MCFLALMFTRIAAVPPEYETSVRGAASQADLTEVLFLAIKENNFTALINYLPDDHHLEVLKNETNALDKVFYENLTAESIRIHTEENFSQVIKTGIDHEVNWSSLQLMEKKPKDIGSLKDIYTTMLVMEDQRSASFFFF